MIPARGLLLVRPVETNETHPGGHILLTVDTRERMTSAQCEVIAVGEPSVCEDVEECSRMLHGWDDKLKMFTHECKGRYIAPSGCPRSRGVRAGDWLLVAPRSFIAGPEPERKEWFVHQDAVLAILSEDAPRADDHDTYLDHPDSEYDDPTRFPTPD